MNFSHSTTPVTAISTRSISDISNTSIEDATKILVEYKSHLEVKSTHHMGYPYNLDFNYSSRALKDLREFSINNLGDPFIESNYGVHSRCFEIAVLDWFADLWDITRESYWGYITACGTEGNLQGIYLGRENYPNGILYASEDSHYSIFKAARMYRMQYEKIRSNSDGTMNIDHFRTCLEKNKEFPAIVNVNIGTTVKGGIDDLDAIIETLQSNSTDFYIHCDGALSGVMLEFITAKNNPKSNKYLSFKDKPIGSISVSGHKFIGSPVPCGIVITRLEYIKVLSSNIDYINSRDATIMGSRNGHTPIYLWYALVKKGNDGLVEDVNQCIINAEFLYNELILRGAKDVLLNKNSSTVVFAIPKNKDLIQKWQLACCNNICHIVVMPNISKEKLLEFLDEYFT